MARKGENIYKRKDGRWEGRYIKSRSSTGKANYGYVYAKSYREVKAKLISQSSCTSNSVTVDPEISSDQFEQVAMEWFQAICPKHGVKAPGEGIFPQIVAGAVNQFAGDLHHTQRFPPHRQGIRIFRQDPQTRFFSPGNGLLLLLQTLAHRFMILFQRHKLSPLKPKNRAARTGKPTFLSTRYHGGKKISIVFLFEKY